MKFADWWEVLNKIYCSFLFLTYSIKRVFFYHFYFTTIMLIPPKLKPWSHIRVIAPSRSLSIVDEAVIDFAVERLASLWLTVSFGEHCKEINTMSTSSVDARLADLHDAFRDDGVDAIFTAIWWYTAHQLLDGIDFDLIKNNPKILCWFSDITTLSNAIFAKTRLVSYSWPHFSTRWMKHHFEYNLEYIKKCLFEDKVFTIEPSNDWSDDAWYIDQDDRTIIENSWLSSCYQWSATGTIIWWHFRCLQTLHWTEYCPTLENTILFIEEDGETNPWWFDRLLRSFVQKTQLAWVKGIVIGRFQKESNMTDEKMQSIITSHIPDTIPVIYNANFGHTNPIFTFPIWWVATLQVDDNQATLEIVGH